MVVPVRLNTWKIVYEEQFRKVVWSGSTDQPSDVTLEQSDVTLEHYCTLSLAGFSESN